MARDVGAGGDGRQGGVFAEHHRMTDIIQYIVCFVFGVITGTIAVTAAVVIIFKEKAPNRGP